MAGLINEIGTLNTNVGVGPHLFIMKIEAPKIAGSILPGQFIHMKVPGMEGHILRRPFSVYAADRDENMIEVLYQVVGFGSRHMTGLKSGETIEMIGPIGTNWQMPEGARRILLVGGGVGAAPLFMLAEQALSQSCEVDIILGAQTEAALVCHERYADLLKTHSLPSAPSLRCATDDGSFGHAGFCTALVEEALGEKQYDYAAVCGPEPMMRIVVGLVKEKAIPCEVSLERRMACGIGACLSCVVETNEGMKRACVDGPIFDAGKVVFS